MCERFAATTLAPRDRLADYLLANPPQPTLDWLQEAADEFRISHSALVIALSAHSWDTEAGYILAGMCGHRLRPDERALRIAHAAGPSRLWLAREKRLASLGWGSLATWAHDQEPGVRRRERDGPITIRAVAPRGVASYTGPVASQAIIVAGTYRTIVAFDASELHPGVPVFRRRKASACEGQLAFAIA